MVIMKTKHFVQSRQAVPRPFLKWAGGKTQLLPMLLAYAPSTFRRYYEPFLGGGAFFFALYRLNFIRQATLSDINAELIDTYLALQRDVESVIQYLDHYPHSEEFYYKLRARNPWELSLAERAARMIYLNKTGYNGLYRVNKQGKFNVPFGRYKRPNYRDFDNLRAVAQALQMVRLEVRSFEWILEEAQAGDFVYFDPPYDPVSKTARFTQYHSSGFGKAEQQLLAKVFRQLSIKKVKVMLSNSDTPFIRQLYQDYAWILPVKAYRFINSRGHKRGPQPELLILNYEPREAGRLFEPARDYS